MKEISQVPKKTSTKIVISLISLLIVIVVSFLSFYYFTNRINFTYLGNIKKIHSQIDDENNKALNSLNKISSISIAEQEEINKIIDEIKKVFYISNPFYSFGNFLCRFHVL